jgi:hypothetical protein
LKLEGFGFRIFVPAREVLLDQTIQRVKQLLNHLQPHTPLSDEQVSQYIIMVTPGKEQTQKSDNFRGRHIRATFVDLVFEVYFFFSVFANDGWPCLGLGGHTMRCRGHQSLS